MKAKDDWIQFQCKSINDDMRHGRHNKRAYATLRTITKTTPRSTSTIEDSNGTPLAEDSMIIKRTAMIFIISRLTQILVF